MRPGAHLSVACLACRLIVCTSTAASEQGLPSEPVALADGLVTLSSDVSASIGPTDAGFFNYTDYEHSALRTLRIDLAASIRAGRHLSLLGRIRSENVGSPDVYALYLRIRPWAAHAFDVQVGRVPPTFGAFARRNYATDNPLIGYPLAYQYLTSLRPDALPADADELLRMRGRGWLASYSIGNPAPDRGVPLASAFRWDTGVQVHAAGDLADLTASITTGTISNPLVRDDNSGRQLAGRIALRPIPGLVAGVSAARGPFVSSGAVRSAAAGGADGTEGNFTQTAWGGDLEYSRAYYLVRAEAVFSQWTIPIVRQPVIAGPLQALGTSVEGRYKLGPAFYVAARADHLGFSEITGSFGPEAWDAPVTRVEVGGGYSLLRNLLLKISGQHNVRDGGRVTSLNLMSAQLVYWF